MKTLFFHSAAAGASLLLMRTEAAAQASWIGAAEGDWFIPANWAPGIVPTSGLDVTINNGSSADIAAPGALSKVITIGTAGGSGGLFVRGVPGGLAGRPNLSSSDDAVAGAAGTGTVTVSDADWTVALQLTAGQGPGGNGAVQVINKGTVTAFATVLGDGAGNGGATGTVVVTGVGSKWTSSSFLQIGKSDGSGTMSVLAGATAETGRLAVGSANDISTTASQLLLDGQGVTGTLMKAQSVFMGTEAPGEVTLRNSARLRVVAPAGEVDRVTVGWKGKLRFGAGGPSGVIEADEIHFALPQGPNIGEIVVDATGDVTLDAAITGDGIIRKSNTGRLLLGNHVDSDVLFIYDGGQLQFGDADGNGDFDGIINTPPGSQVIFNPSGAQTGSVALTGGGSMLKTGNGTYTLTKAQSMTGNTNVNGGTLRVASATAAGGLTATQNVQVDGLSANAPAPVLEVTGAQSTVNATQNTSAIAVTIGNSHEATLRILNGGKVTGQIGQAGVFPGSHAGILVDAGTWTHTDDLTLGRNGVVVATVQNGGSLSGRNVLIGSNSAGNGSLTVTGAGSSAAVTAGSFTVGSTGTGGLNILAGGAVTGGGLVGSGTDGRGTVLISGPGSVWNAGSVRIGTGSNSTGLVTVADGGTLEQPGVNVRLGQNGIGSGVLAIGNGGLPGTVHALGIQFGGIVSTQPIVGPRVWFNHLRSYDWGLGITGTGGAILKEGSGTTNITSNGLTYSGTVTVNDGNLCITGALPNVTVITVNAGGTLCGSGAWGKTSTITNLANAGTLDAGAGQTITLSGALTNNGLIRLHGGTLNFQSAATFVNEGVIDLTGGGIFTPPAAFTNNGVILTAPPVKVLDFNLTGGSFTLHVTAKGGLTYQLQRSSSLSGSWAPFGSAQTPAADANLTFTDLPAPAGAAFYRIALLP